MTPPSPSLPVTVLTGFLGAGKTTLLNRMLRAPGGRRIAAIVNDIGTVDVDAQMVRSVHGRVMSLWNGCICCDVEGDLRLSLLNLADMAAEIDAIVVEASGIADPLAIASTFRVPELRDRVRLDGIVTLVDAEHARDPRLDRQLVHDQIALADLVLLNKVDLVDSATVADLHTWIRSIAHRARILDTSASGRPGPAPLDVLLDLDADPRDPTPAGHEHAHATGFETWTVHLDAPLDLHDTIAALKTLPEGVFRAKGFLLLRDAPRLKLLVQVVGNRVSTDVLGPWGEETPATDLVFIGRKGATQDEELNAHLLGAPAVPG